MFANFKQKPKNKRFRISAQTVHDPDEINSRFIHEINPEETKCPAPAFEEKIDEMDKPLFKLRKKLFGKQNAGWIEVGAPREKMKPSPEQLHPGTIHQVHADQDVAKYILKKFASKELFFQPLMDAIDQTDEFTTKERAKMIIEFILQANQVQVDFGAESNKFIGLLEKALASRRKILSTLSKTQKLKHQEQWTVYADAFAYGLQFLLKNHTVKQQ